MAYTSEIDEIPPGQADQVVQDFMDAGATDVKKTEQSDGNFSVIATFDDVRTGIQPGPSSAGDGTQSGSTPSPQPPVGQLPTEISLSWDTVPERKTWSDSLIASVSNSKAQLDQSNPGEFIQGYENLSPELQLKFWCELLVAVSKFESSWNPHDIYHEPAPLGIDSIGLLQLSYEDAAHYKLEPLDKATKSLEDPTVNLRCGLTIFATLLSRDKTVASSANGKYRGAAAYWSTLRAGHKVDQIIALTKSAVGL